MVGTVGDISKVEEFFTLRQRIAIQNNVVTWLSRGHIMTGIHAVLITLAVEMEIGIGPVRHGDAPRGWL